MSTFGNTSTGGFNTVSSVWMYLIKASPSTSGTLTSASFRAAVASAGTRNYRGVIYSYDSSTTGTLIAVTADGSYSSTTTQLLSSSFSGTYTVDAGTNYWIGIMGDGDATTFGYISSTTTYTPAESIQSYSGGLPAFASGAPSTFSGFAAGGTYQYVSAYLTYTPSPTTTGVSSTTGVGSITF